MPNSTEAFTLSHITARITGGSPVDDELTVEPVQQLIHAINFSTNPCDVIRSVGYGLGHGLLFFLNIVGRGFETRCQ